jgi:hypothetical protein
MSKLVSSTVLAISIAFGLAFTGSIVASANQDPAAPPATPKQNSKLQNKQLVLSVALPKRRPAASSEATGDQTTAAPEQMSSTAAQTTAAPTQTDLSGTYTGTFNCDSIGLTGDTTLTINGNQFTTADGKTGRIVASTTRGYTAVALQMGDANASTPTIVSLRSRKSGDRLTLTSVDAAHPCSFAPTRATTSRRTRKSVQTAPEAVGAEVASPAEAGPAPADVTAPAKATPGKTRKRNYKEGDNHNACDSSDNHASRDSNNYACAPTAKSEPESESKWFTNW